METADAAKNSWGLATKQAFRFFFIFFILMLLPLPDMLLSPIARHMLHIGYTPPAPSNGSGDTSWHYIRLSGALILSLTGCILWSALDYRRSSYSRLYQWYSVYVRYSLSVVLFSYGIQKVIQAQFPPLMGGQLWDSYGQSTPMGLLWRFMQYSHAYNVFSGCLEILPAVLLLFRRTRMLGALIAIAVMTNVVALNFCYDVPVKIFSTELLLMACFIAAGDVRRLIDFFIRNKPVAAVDLPPYFESQKMQYAGMSVKALMLAGMLLTLGIGVSESTTALDRMAAEGPLTGSYTVETFVMGHDTLPPLTTDTVRWSRFGLAANGGAGVRYMNDAGQYYKVDIDTARRTLSFATKEGTSLGLMHYTRIGPQHLMIQGKFAADSLTVYMMKTDIKKTRLLSRGFHWINEVPMNR